LKITDRSLFYDTSIEQIIDYLVQQKITVNNLILELDFSNNYSQEDEELIQKISIAETRMNEPLELSLKLFYFFFPFGLVNFLSKEDENLKRFHKYRYKRKIRDYFVFSLLGSLFFIIIGLLLGWYFQNK